MPELGWSWGYPVALAESMPDIGTDAHPIAFGNWQRGYVLAQRSLLTVTADPFTTPGEIRTYLRYRVGGCVYDENAVRLVKCATT